MIKFINLKNYEISDEIENFIYCDAEIAQTIAILNKKGYKTAYSCAGHNNNGNLWPTQKDPIEAYDECLKDAESDKTIHIIGKDNQYFYHKDDITATYTYIAFDKIYEFPTIPEGFKMDLFNDNKISIGKFCEFFIDKKNYIRKIDKEINKELLENQKKLYDWALSLDYIEKGER